MLGEQLHCSNQVKPGRCRSYLIKFLKRVWEAIQGITYCVCQFFIIFFFDAGILPVRRGSTVHQPIAHDDCTCCKMHDFESVCCVGLCCDDQRVKSDSRKAIGIRGRNKRHEIGTEQHKGLLHGFLVSGLQSH